MRWYQHLAYFFGGAFLTNFIPHFVAGVTGHSFQSPFATPPGEGLSSPTVNVLWGFANLVVGYLLLCRVGKFSLRDNRHVIHVGTGVIAMALMLAHAFGRFYANGG